MNKFLFITDGGFPGWAIAIIVIVLVALVVGVAVLISKWKKLLCFKGTPANLNETTGGNPLMDMKSKVSAYESHHESMMMFRYFGIILPASFGMTLPYISKHNIVELFWHNVVKSCKTDLFFLLAF